MKRARRLELCFTPDGQIELTPVNSDTVLWASDDDEDFHEHFKKDFFSYDTDASDVLHYLIDHQLITQGEAEELDIFEESYDGEDLEGHDTQD